MMTAATSANPPVVISVYFHPPRSDQWAQPMELSMPKEAMSQ
jgi:hypothetical protein